MIRRGCMASLTWRRTKIPAVAEINADSYAWMSLDAWISDKCSTDDSGNNWASYFTQDPPPYEHEEAT